MKRKFTSLLCAVLMMAVLTALPASAAGSWPDLSETHWAYDILVRANELGIINGRADGTMAPGDTLTWGEYLTMLSKTFQGDAYLDYPAPAGANWAYPYYAAVAASGAISDFMPVQPDTLGQPIARQDAALLAVLLLDGGTPEQAPDPEAPDFDQLPESYRPGVARAVDLGLLSGYADGTLGGDKTLTRAQGPTILLAALDASQQESAEPTVTPDPADPDPAEPTDPDPADPVDPDPADDTNPDDDDTSWGWGWGWGWDDWDTPDYGDDPLKWPGENEAKYMLLFGSDSKRRFANKDEAEANMVTITVPVWHLKDGSKVAAQASFRIHQAIAEDTVAIFTEIFNDPEQFPISSVGGYSWRGDTATGEHNCGTAIDINPNENYQIRDGQALVGTLWEPGVNPFSMPADGSVVRIFRAHGWDWGGDAWAWDADPSEGYHDYMHLSYMGG